MKDSRTARALRYLIAQGATDRSLRSALTLTKASIAREAGISPRSLDRYLSGERQPPDDVSLRLQVVAQDRLAAASAEFREEAKRERVPYKTVDKLPLRSSRYKRPKKVSAGAFEESEIILVDTKGLDNSEVAELLREYWSMLAATDRDWNVRLLVNVSVVDYFGPKGPANADVKKSIGGRSFTPMWIPPAPFLFVTQRGSRSVKGGRISRIKYPSADAAISALNDVIGYSYAGRIPQEFAFLKVAFIPIRAYDGKPHRKAQKRRGKR